MKRTITFTIATSSVTVLFSQWYFVSFPRPRAQSNCNETVGFCRLWQVGCVSLFSQFGFNRTRIFHCYDLHIQIAGGTLETRLNDKQATLGQVTKQPDKFEARKRYKMLAIARKNKCSMRVYSCYWQNVRSRHFIIPGTYYYYFGCKSQLLKMVNARVPSAWNANGPGEKSDWRFSLIWMDCGVKLNNKQHLYSFVCLLAT